MELYWDKFRMKNYVIIIKTNKKTSNTTTNQTNPNNIVFLFSLNVLKPDALKDESVENTLVVVEDL